ncbi:hypothetical protein [Streptomyces sp. S1D4-14]|uniref:hypothetical protein n=1 Tax=Streptomyces sp. S1D4-14 TaxID=2594461 RepID=UPI00116492E8|nr:hypothetical protein [Streptomyces sp. S1D4-14]QDN64464.1 hypothetical protein FNV66_01120 [Streptomyces sp. S1D4-14]
MEPFEISGSVADTALRLAPGDGKLVLSVLTGSVPEHRSVALEPSYLLPLAAWFAGEACPGIVGHDEYGTPYGRWLTIGGDEAAVMYGTHTEARMRCTLPFGKAGVTIGQRGRTGGFTVTLSPEARQGVAAWLRRMDAESWPELPVR